MKKFLSIPNFLVVAIAISIPLVITDKYMRFARLPKNNGRIMLLSGGRLDSMGTGIGHYTPNSLVRHSAVYGDVLEYSYEFKTDDNGFRVTYDCGVNNKNDLVAIAGDSFTEGQGSNSVWTERIQKQLCDQGYDSINTAIAGYSVIGMKDSLDYAQERLGAKKAIIAIIPEDIYRPLTPIYSNHTCSMYKSQQCGYSATWWHHPKHFNDKDIIKFAKGKYDFGLIPAIDGAIFRLKSSIAQSLGDFGVNDSSRPEAIRRSISAMDSIVSKYGAKNVLLIVLPTKNDRDLEGSIETKTRRGADLRIFLNSLNKNVLVKDLRDCPLEAKHFFKNDGHPNEEGHRQLGNCASKSSK